MNNLLNMGFIFGLTDFFENIKTIQAIILIVGVLLIFAEIFLPGFGIAGGSGTLLVIIGIIMTARSVTEAVVMFLILFLLLAVVTAIVLKSARKGKLSKTLVLNLSSDKEKGYSSKSDYTALNGLKGKALTSLRPSGTVIIGGRRYDVITTGSFIDKDTEVIVVNSAEGKIVVEEYMELN